MSRTRISPKPGVALLFDDALTAELGKLLVQCRQDCEEIAHETVIRDLENRRLIVLVDGDDNLGVLHSGKVLDGAGDADSDVEIGATTLPVWPTCQSFGA